MAENFGGGARKRMDDLHEGQGNDMLMIRQVPVFLTAPPQTKWSNCTGEGRSNGFFEAPSSTPPQKLADEDQCWKHDGAVFRR